MTIFFPCLDTYTGVSVSFVFVAGFDFDTGGSLALVAVMSLSLSSVGMSVHCSGGGGSSSSMSAAFDFALESFLDFFLNMVRAMMDGLFGFWVLIVFVNLLLLTNVQYNE